MRHSLLGHPRQRWVLAYLCSHILAFDVQAHRGVLQVCTAGAGTAHRMPEDVEYLHCVQAAIDAEGLRYQVIDVEGRIREELSWPVVLPPIMKWYELPAGEQESPIIRDTVRIVALRFAGHASSGTSAIQTLLTAFDPGAQPRLWIGLRGPEQKLTVTIGPEDRRSPHYWHGPSFTPGRAFDFQLLIHAGMGPGGIMYRLDGDDRWSSLVAASPWGAERVNWPARWRIGCGHGGPDDRPFRGLDLKASVTIEPA
jgi:hypothetical protein